MTDHKIIERAITIAPELAKQSDAIERARRVPLNVAKSLAGLGMFRMLVPRKLRGLEVHPAVFVRALAELARGDAACAWHVMTGATNGLLSAYLPIEVAQKIWAEDQLRITAGVFAPAGRAIPIDGGYRLSGRWPFASGCQNASWLMGGALVMTADGPRQLDSGKPEIRSLIFPAEQARVIDTWDVAGLCGTGSHHIEVSEAIVAASHSCSLLTDTPRHAGPLYRFGVFGLLAAGVAAVGIGIARAAIDAFSELAHSKKSPGAKHALCRQDLTQTEIARATGELNGARALLTSSCDEAFRTAEHGALTQLHRAQLRLACTQATRQAVRAVDAMYHAGAGTALYRTSPLQRHFRDMHAVTQHIMVSPMIDKTVGRVLLGLPTDASQL